MRPGWLVAWDCKTGPEGGAGVESEAVVEAASRWKQALERKRERVPDSTGRPQALESILWDSLASTLPEPLRKAPLRTHESFASCGYPPLNPDLQGV